MSEHWTGKSQYTERIEASRQQRIQAARARYDKFLVVIIGYSDGASHAEISRRLEARWGKGAGTSRISVWRMATILGLETGRRYEATGKRTGRRDTKQTLLEVRP